MRHTMVQTLETQRSVTGQSLCSLQDTWPFEHAASPNAANARSRLTHASLWCETCAVKLTTLRSAWNA